MRVLRYGSSAALVEVDDGVAEVHGLVAAGSGIRGVVELVAGARTVLIRYDPAQTDVPALAAELSALEAAAVTPPSGPLVEIPVVYDGADLDEVASLVGLSAREVVERHAAADYVVAFCGFAPGFGYLVGGDPTLHVPRRPSPRTRVPGGSVAIAGEYSGVYPREMPGGWRLLGRTSASLWDADREPAALLAPGRRVRFVPAGGPP